MADLVIVVAKTDPAAGAKGTSLLLVETDDAEGFKRGRNLDKIGMKAQDTSELFFNDVQRAGRATCIGGGEGQGFIQLMQQLPQERLNIAVQGVAAIERGAGADRGLREGAQGLRQGDHRFPEHPASSWPSSRPRRPGRAACSSTTASLATSRASLDAADRGDGQVLTPPTCSASSIDQCLQLLRRLWLHVGIPDRAPLRRRARPEDLRRHQRDHERADRPHRSDGSDCHPERAKDLMPAASGDESFATLRTTEPTMTDASSTTPSAPTRQRKDGSLHEVPAVRLAVTVLQAIRDRNKLDTAPGRRHRAGLRHADRRAGSVIARAAAFEAG